MYSGNKNYKGGINIRKIISLILIAAILVNCVMNSYAINNTPKIVKIGEIENHLKYFREDRGYSTYVVCSVVGFYENNIFYPAYCMNKNLPGAEKGEYEVNIKEIIKNPAIWRIVLNGFPYKTSEQMGLANDFDAFAVTKFAIYCVLGESKIEYYSANENDAYGQKMLQVLRNLVDIGINGTEKPSENSIFIVPNSVIQENNKYYYIDYKINSNIEVNLFEIVSSYNLPVGTFFSDINDCPQKSFSANQIMRVQIPKEEFNKNILGDVHFKAKGKTYPIFYGEAPVGKQDYIVTFDGIGEIEFKGNINIEANTGNLKIVKKDKDSLKGISNVKFEVSNELYKYEIETNEDGIAEVKNMYPGKYKVKEIYVTDEYEILEDEIEVNIFYNKLEVLEVTNELKKGNLKIVKKDKDSLDGISNIKFEVSNELYKYEVETNENGIAEVKNMYPGKYKIKEIYVPDEYEILENEVEVNISHEKLEEIEILNELKKGNIKVIKLGEKEEKLSGVEFAIFDENMKLLEKLITDENGECISKMYPSINKKYYLKEISTLDGYIINDNIEEIVLEYGAEKEIKLINEKEKMEEVLPKTDNEIKEEIKLPKTGY